MMQILKAGVLYFACVFGAGFVLGTVRTLWVVRRIGLDIQFKMLDGLRHRLAKAGLLERVDMRLVQPDSVGLAELAGSADFALAFAVVHEMPSACSFSAELSRALKPGRSILFAEPTGHVKAALWDAELEAASQAGFIVADRPSISRSHAVLLKK